MEMEINNEINNKKEKLKLTFAQFVDELLKRDPRTVGDLNIISQLTYTISDAEFIKHKNAIMLFRTTVREFGKDMYKEISPKQLARYGLVVTGLVNERVEPVYVVRPTTQTHARDTTTLTDTFIASIPNQMTTVQLNELIVAYYNDIMNLGLPVSQTLEKTLRIHGFNIDTMQFSGSAVCLAPVLISILGKKRGRIMRDYNNANNANNTNNVNTQPIEIKEQPIEILTDALNNLITGLKNTSYTSSINGIIAEYYAFVTDLDIKHSVVTAIDAILKPHGWRWEENNHGFTTAADRDKLYFQISCCIADTYPAIAMSTLNFDPHVDAFLNSKMDLALDGKIDLSFGASSDDDPNIKHDNITQQ